MKNIINIVSISLFLIFTLSSCYRARPTKLETTDNRECAQNFTYDGSFFSGRLFKTHQFIKNISKKDAVNRATKYIARDGYIITDSDEEMGIISGYIGVIGSSRTVPFNITVDQVNNGVNVIITKRILGGMTVHAPSVQNTFCSIMESIDK